MANRAYWGLWLKNYSAGTMLDQFERLLSTIPFSAEFPGCTSMLIRAVDAAETPLVDMDLRATPLSPEQWIAIARDYLNSDCIFEVQAFWDVWHFEDLKSRWQRTPKLLEIFCHGPDYDSGVGEQLGHFQAEIGFEHLFTGHARILGPHPGPADAPQDAAEARFQMIMSVAENLREYHRKTQENIQKLQDWLREIEKVLPVERYRLWSEGEENFEARMDEILAVR